MFLVNASLKRPVALLCLIIALTFLGLNSFRKIGLELMPKADIPYLTVTTLYPGASPSDIEVDVARPIEDAVMTVEGLKHVASICMENVATTLLEFQMGTDIDRCAQDVREKIDTILSKFPSGVEKPIILKMDIGALPIVNLALVGDLPIEDLYDYAEKNLSDRLSSITGVANVSVLGGAKKEVQIHLDRRAMAAAGLSSAQVANIVSSSVINLPAGRVVDGPAESNVRFDSNFTDISELGAIQVAGTDGKRRYLKDLSEIKMGPAQLRQATFLNGKRCVALKVVKRADANVVETVNSIRNAMNDLAQELPGGMELVWVNDEGAFVQATVDNTTNSIIMGIFLTAIILFLFLFNPKSTFIVAITMPLTIVISAFFLYFMGQTINAITLMAAGLSVGVLVTNSIVVMENISSILKRTGDPKEAAQKGASDIAIAVIAGVGTNVVVLLPIGLMGGIVGMIFQPFAWTTLIVNVVSLFISFSLTPILAMKMMKKSNGNNQHFYDRAEYWVNEKLSNISSAFTNWLAPLLRSRKASFSIILISIFVFIFSLFIFSSLGFDFTPGIDKGEMLVTVEFPTGQNLETTIAKVKEIENELRSLPDIRFVLTNVGKIEGMLGYGTEGVEVANIMIQFSEKSKRDMTLRDFEKIARKRLENYPGATIGISTPGVIGGQDLPVEIQIEGDDLDILEDLAHRFQKLASSIDGFSDPNSSVREGKPEIIISPKREVLDDIGLNTATIAMTLRTNLEGATVGSFKRGDRSFDINLKLSEEEGFDQIQSFSLNADRNLSFSGLANIEKGLAKSSILRMDKKRITKMFSGLSPDLPLSEAVKIMQKQVDEAGFMPPGYNFSFQGAFERMDETIGDFLEAGIMAILLTYLTLSAILESFVKPFSIMFTIPLGLIGVSLALFLSGSSISIFVLLGMVMLIGIVVNNAVLIFDQVHLSTEEGLEPIEAMIVAIKEKFRPVIMITLAAILGMLPLATSRGLGSELTADIGISSIGGIMVSSILTLIVIPALYCIVQKRK